MRSLRHSYTILLALLTAALAVVSCGRRGSAAVEKLEQGEANYKAGTSSNYASHYEESVYYLKQAEEAFLDVDPAALSPEMQGKRTKFRERDAVRDRQGILPQVRSAASGE